MATKVDDADSTGQVSVIQFTELITLKSVRKTSMSFAADS